jgi:hypothetical protein
MFETQGRYLVTRDVREQVTQHYGRERNRRGGDTTPDGAVVETRRPEALQLLPLVWCKPMWGKTLYNVTKL